MWHYFKQRYFKPYVKPPVKPSTKQMVKPFGYEATTDYLPKEFGRNTPEIAKESIWGTSANWGDAEHLTPYPTLENKLSAALGYQYIDPVSMYDPQDPHQHEQLEQLQDLQDGYAGGRAFSHRDSEEQPAELTSAALQDDLADVTHNYNPRLNAPRQPLTASQIMGRPPNGPTYGMYADMPVVLYSDKDTKTADQWGAAYDKLYLYNSYRYNEEPLP
jgi:hypothetical protein